MLMIMEKLLELIKIRKPFVLATVIEAKGSSPGKIGFKMIYTKDQELYGTVGGGLVEAKIIEEAQNALETNKSTTLEYDLSPGNKGIGMQCGGTMKVFLEVFLPKARLLLCGGGHVGYEIAKIAEILKLETILLEERSSFATEDRFPNIKRIVKEDYRDALKEVKVDEYTYVVIVTKGHLTDQVVLEEIIDKPAAYVGLMGSRRKKEEVMKYMKSRGYSDSILEGVHCPIGLDLNADTPEEIALSIIAEVIAVKNKGKGGFLK
ncbi:XdhC family protein [Alkaliphilus pronyensis]|uniref:XdhC family protein n=1 Tax=Alkaliphilus pronyensis TaxID=1482732 RepID=A0A6I0FL85_9FIRM|nr:XdhC family protein [Alkaliphilus pronyensis]KAB3540952.1 XdhC family protein [Alkaliphilus pronyensis]